MPRLNKNYKEQYDEAVVEVLVLAALGQCPPLGSGEFNAKVTWCALGDCPEQREANRRIAKIREENKRQGKGSC